MIFNLCGIIADFFCYWYFRYLMVTELYMVERWERAVTNVTILLLFLTLSYFNHAVLLHYISSFSKSFLIV